jgi:arylsulfatase A-like enzyme
MGRLWYTYVNFLGPHAPFAGPFENHYDPSERELSPSFEGPMGEREPLRYRLMQEFHWHETGGDVEAYRKIKAMYWGRVTQVDVSIGGILDALESLGLSESTMVVFTSEHGEMLGDHRMLHKQQQYDGAARVPLLIRYPDKRGAGRRVATPVSQIDLVPTLLETLGGSIPDALPGDSLTRFLDGRKRGEDHAFMEWNPNNKSAWFKEGTSIASEIEIDQVYEESVRTVVSPDGWKLSLSDIDRHQLFDLRSDPWERVNRISDASVSGIVKRLRRKLSDWQKRVGDRVEV